MQELFLHHYMRDKYPNIFLMVRYYACTLPEPPQVGQVSVIFFPPAIDVTPEPPHFEHLTGVPASELGSRPLPPQRVHVST